MPLAPSSRRASRAHVAGDVHVVPLAERHLVGRHRARVLEPAELQGHELRLGDLGQHVDQPHLLDLGAGDRLVEHHPALRVAERLVVARHRRADGAPRDAVARLREAHERALEAARLGQDGVLREMDVLRGGSRSCRWRGARASPSDPWRRTPWCRSGTMKPRMDLVSSMAPVLAQMMDTVAWEPFVIHILVPFSTQPSVVSRAVVIMPPGFEPKSGSVRPKQPISCPEASSGSQWRLLLLGAEGIDRIHHQRALHRGERADARVAPLELLHDEPVGHVVEARAAVFLRQVGAEQPQLGHAGDELLGKLPFDVGLADDGQQVLVHPGPDGVPDRALLLGEQGRRARENPRP